MNDKKRTIFFILGLILFIGLFESAAAEDFPKKPVQVLVGFGPGGETDLIARAMASVAPEFLGQPLVVVNMPGAAGTLAASKVAKAEPDGYTLNLAGGSETISVGHFKELPYHPINSFEPIMRIARLRIVLCVNANAPWKSLKEFINDAKNNPGKYKHSSVGHGSAYHAVMLILSDQAGVVLKHIPYKSGAESLAALMGGHVDIALGTPAEARVLAEGGKIRVIAVASEDRSPLLPDVPTIKEQLGFNIFIENMKGFVAPLNTPKERITFLHDAFKKAYDHKAFKSLAEKLHIELGYLGPDDFRRAMQSMYDQVGRTVKKVPAK